MTVREIPAALGSPVHFDAVVFDLDGVITLTADTHRAAWKKLFDVYLEGRADRYGELFQEFTEEDYRTFVDGRPRYDGVRAFLASRAIDLPAGDPADPADIETVCGLGNRKNVLFGELLDRDGVDVDREVLRLIQELRKRSISVAVASSSRNCRPILQRAGIETLFEAIVDGTDSVSIELRGKPHPDIFLEALGRIGKDDPSQAVIFEDATSGVEAGRAGGFGLVVGIDRGGNRIPLREHGADWVVTDTSVLEVAQLDRFLADTSHKRPNAIHEWSRLRYEIGTRDLAVFLDYDGTLTPIVPRPELAHLSNDMREVLGRLSATWPTHIVSGRGLDDVQSLVGVDSLVYAASHGFDLSGPDLRHEVHLEIVPEITAACDEIRQRISQIPGTLVENKRFSGAVHYRQVEPTRVPEIEQAVDDALARLPGLRKSCGKKVFEVRPKSEWDKGKAVLWLLEELGLDRPEVMPLYVGDDTTDEDAFRAISTRGIGVRVSEFPEPTDALYTVQDTFEVQELLERLARIREGGSK